MRRRCAETHARCLCLPYVLGRVSVATVGFCTAAMSDWSHSHAQEASCVALGQVQLAICKRLIATEHPLRMTPATGLGCVPSSCARVLRTVSEEVVMSIVNVALWLWIDELRPPLRSRGAGVVGNDGSVVTSARG